MPVVRVNSGTDVHYAEQWNLGGAVAGSRADDPAELDILLGSRNVYDVASSAYGQLSSTDGLNNNAVVQAASDAAVANGGGIVLLSRSFPMRPRATQAVAL